ncbi:hypothetical protein [Mesorhizobium sp. YR577]|nr:hypothetical protein [Mesorhizobium sp. YR577]
MRLIEQNAAHGGVGCENLSKHRPLTATDIHDPIERRKVVARNDGFDDPT